MAKVVNIKIDGEWVGKCNGYSKIYSGGIFIGLELMDYVPIEKEDIKGISDKIYDDLKQKVFDWKETNAIDRNGSTPDDYRNHSLGATEYSYRLLWELTSELISRFADDGELNETWFKEVEK